MPTTALEPSQAPSAPTFSYNSPFQAFSSSPASSSTRTPATPLKQRRVSLALPSSTRITWNFRDDTSLDSHVPETQASTSPPEKQKKMRKIASEENEIFPEKKQRKKWSDEETQMLVKGCNVHGVGNWKTILSDPNLTFDNRSPVDLKDRFRTYFPDAYKEHYPNARTHLSSKVRSTLPDGSSLFEKTRSKKRRPFTEEEDRALKAGYEKHGTVWAAIVKDPIFKEQGRRSTDLRDRFRNAFPELYQAAGYKPRNSVKKKLTAHSASLPVRAATDDQLSLSTTGPVRSRRRSHTTQGLYRGGTKSVPQSAVCSEDEDSSGGEDETSLFKTPHTPILVPNAATHSRKSGVFDDEEMDMVTLEQSDPSLCPDFSSPSQSRIFPHFTSELDNHSQTWSSGVNTPTHSTHAWSAAAGSPTSTHLSPDCLATGANQSPSFQRLSINDPRTSIGMIGKSAWGTHDWFSANPRLDDSTRTIGTSSSNSSTSFPLNANTNATTRSGGIQEALFSSSPPFTPSSFHQHTHSFNLASFVHQGGHGVLDRYDLHPTALSSLSFPHDFASEIGDTHSTFSDEMFPPPTGFRGFTHHSNYAGDLIFGARTMAGAGHIHPQHNSQQQSDDGGRRILDPDDPGIGIMVNDMDILQSKECVTQSTLQRPPGGGESASGEEVIMIPLSPLHSPQDQIENESRFSLDDLVDLEGHEHDAEEFSIDLDLHATPPGTPLLSHTSRSLTRAMATGPTQGYHARSISVPPSETREDSVHSPTSRLGKTLTGAGRLRLSGQERKEETQEAIALDLATTMIGFLGVGAGDMAPSNQVSPSQVRRRERQQAVTAVTSSQPAPAPAPPPLPRSRNFTPQMLHPVPQTVVYPSRPSPLSPMDLPAGSDVNPDLPFLDLHYYTQGVSGGIVGGGGSMDRLRFSGDDATEIHSVMRQGQALDLAASSANLVNSSLNMNSGILLPSFSKASMIPAALRQPQHVLSTSWEAARVRGHPASSPSSCASLVQGSVASSSGRHNGGGHQTIMNGANPSRPVQPCLSHQYQYSQMQYHPHHQRRQSAVCTEDMILRTGDNKRKRASWDGAQV